MNSNKRYLFGAILSFLGMIVFYLATKVLYNPSANYERENAMSFSGMVTAKYMDRHPTIDLDTNGKYTIHLVALPLWDSLKIGDSIFKRGGDNAVVVFRQGRPIAGGLPFALFRQP